MSDWSDEATDNPLRADDRNFYKVEKWSEGWREGRADAVRRQQSRQGERHICEGDQAPAADKVDHPAEDAGARAVAAQTCAGRLI